MIQKLRKIADKNLRKKIKETYSNFRVGKIMPKFRKLNQ